jgi:hypothetical protein
MVKITELGKSKNDNMKVSIDIGNITGTKGKSSNGNETYRLYGSHVINGKVYYLTGNLTKGNK